MTDPRITRETVLETIYAEANDKRTIWSPYILLKVMKIERYPNIQKQNRLAMKQILLELCIEELIVKRPELHSYYGHKEVAYERVSPTDDA